MSTTGQANDPSPARSDQVPWNEEYEGKNLGTNVSVIIVTSDTVGDGPALHRHPYAETFVIKHGRALFTIGDEERVGIAGEILIVPPTVPHKFENLGPERLEQVDIHDSPEFITEWL